ncbi:SDR family oxidoreductase [Delftia sp. WSY_7]|uniref:SDR family oxidoreductase n=1 Tax=Delftia sp. WSY_7 TaxID=3367202 RepID=UPI00370BBE45
MVVHGHLGYTEGARVIVTGVNPDSIAKAQAELGSDVPVLRADSASVAAQKALAQTVKDRFGQLDIAFLNGSVPKATLRKTPHLTETGWDASNWSVRGATG